jgi:hypothetical protein
VRSPSVRVDRSIIISDSTLVSAIVVTQRGARLQNRLARQIWLEYGRILGQFSSSQRKAAIRILKLIRAAAEGRLRPGMSFRLESL